MVKKLKQMADKKSQSSSGLFDSALASTVKDSAQQIWLAGLGAFAKAQEEGGKVFDALVKEGVTLQKKTQSVAEDRIGDVTGKMSSMAGDVSAKAGQHWDKLESIFEERVQRALSKMGVPTQKDLAALQAQIDALQGSAPASLKPVAKRGARPAAKAATAATPADKPATKRAAARKSAA